MRQRIRQDPEVGGQQIELVIQKTIHGRLPIFLFIFCFHSLVVRNQKPTGLGPGDFGRQRCCSNALPSQGVSLFFLLEKLQLKNHRNLAVDVWSAGTILLFFLTGKFPVFHCPNDTEALVELTVLLGRKAMERTGLLHSTGGHTLL